MPNDVDKPTPWLGMTAIPYSLHVETNPVIGRVANHNFLTPSRSHVVQMITLKAENYAISVNVKF